MVFYFIEINRLNLKKNCYSSFPGYFLLFVAFLKWFYLRHCFCVFILSKITAYEFYVYPSPLHSVLHAFSAWGRLSMSMIRVLSWDCVIDPMELFMDCPVFDDGRIWPLFLKNTMVSNLNKWTVIMKYEKIDNWMQNIKW